MTTRRIKLTVEYDGSAFYGWQRQPNLPTVQGAIEEAIFKLTQQKPNVYTAGRTDAGVHGLNQVCHFELEPCKHRLLTFKDGINRFTPDSISILKAEEVSEHFHARFSAQARAYEFHILNRRAPSAIYRHHAVHVPFKLDVELMATALKDLIGEHDFSAFRTTECQSSTPMCNMQKIEVVQEGDLIKFHIQADHFLHNMIRITVGTAVDIGRGHLPADTFKKMLQTGNRKDGGVTLAPQGLYFKEVIYDASSFEVIDSTDK